MYYLSVVKLCQVFTKALPSLYHVVPIVVRVDGASPSAKQSDRRRSVRGLTRLDSILVKRNPMSVGYAKVGAKVPAWEML